MYDIVMKLIYLHNEHDVLKVLKQNLIGFTKFEYIKSMSSSVGDGKLSYRTVNQNANVTTLEPAVIKFMIEWC